jgi:hypothetical protein
MLRGTLPILLCVAGLCGVAPLLMGAHGGCGSLHASRPDAGIDAGTDAGIPSAGAAADSGAPSPLAGAGGDRAGQGGSAGQVAVGGEAAPALAGRGGHAGRAGSESMAGEPGMQDIDAGASCISREGGVCGGNTRQPCACETGLVCTPDASSSLPTGDVGGTCLRAEGSSACQSSADCQVQADYCTGCDCVALGQGQSVRGCSGPGVDCLLDPCGSKTAQCVAGKCVAQ